MSKKETVLQQEESALQNTTQATPGEQENKAEEPTVIVLAFRGTESLVKRIWEKHFKGDVEVLSYPEDQEHLKELLTFIIAEPMYSKTVVLIPANLVPVAPVSLNDLMVARVDVNNNQKRFWGRVPVTFDKEVLVDFLPEHEGLSDEEFVEAYLKLQGVRPMEVAHAFGNFYAKVLRGNPCENVVIEALIRKRFIFANLVGWNAITGLLEKTLAE